MSRVSLLKLFNLLAKNKINVDLQSVGRDGTKDISFTIPLMPER